MSGQRWKIRDERATLKHAGAGLLSEMTVRDFLLAQVGPHHVDPRQVIGCTAEEVAAIERERGLRLPRSYREFLETCGKKADRFCVSEQIFYPDLLKFPQWTLDILLEDGCAWRPAPSHFIFWMHDGIEFAYFDCASVDEPPIYQWWEGRSEPTVAWQTFGDFLADMMGKDDVRYSMFR